MCSSKDEIKEREICIMDYNLKLKKILTKHGFLEEDYGGPTIINLAIEETVKRATSDLGSHPRIGIWGGGEHTVAIIKLRAIRNLNIVGIYDNSDVLWDKKINGLSIKPISEIEDDEIDIILISSYLHRLNIKNEINNRYPGLRCIDMYERDKNGGSGLELLDVMTSMSDYNIISHAIKDYSMEETSEKLKTIIWSYLNIKDFISSKVFIKEYISKKYVGYEKMIELDKDLDGLIKCMKDEISSNKNKNILLMVLDSLRGKDVLASDSEIKMPFVNKLYEDSIAFKNSFSPSTYTTESHRSIFCGKRLFEDDTFKVEKINDTNSEFIKNLKDMDYNLCNYDTLRIIDNKVFNEIGIKEALKPMTKLMWDYICNTIESKGEKNFSYIRFMESHTPHNSGYNSIVDERYSYGKPIVTFDEDEDYEKYLQSIRYIDYQLEFYLDIIKDDMIVITADHGNNFKDTYSFSGNPNIWGDNRIHVPLIIKNNYDKYSNRIIDSLFSTKDLTNIILDILERKDINIDDNDYIIIERSPIYNEDLKREFVDQKLDYMIQALRMIRTDKEKYIRYEDGKEEYYLLEDETKNIINDNRYLDRLEYFRSLKENGPFPKFVD